MLKRLLAERKEELERTLKKDKRYVVCITTKFEGKFSHFETVGGEEYVVFTQDGHTDRGSIPTRRVKLQQVQSAGLIKT
jgi:hypothetical protein